jgi:uncharacterized protein (TIGR00255 family)
MTGYGRATIEHNGKAIAVEIRAVNSKTLDIKMKLPTAFRLEEIELRKRISQETERGKIDIHISTQDLSGENHAINHHLFELYSRELKQLCADNQLPTQDILRGVLTMPNIYEADDELSTPEDFEAVKTAFEAAIQQFNLFRKDEGEALFNDFLMRNDLILKYLDQLSPFEQERTDRVRTRLERSLQDLLNANNGKNFDENRLEQELLFYLEKMDITEEKTRLRQHCDYFLKELQTTDYIAKGRKLNFISQEMGREINTIGSKAGHAEMQRVVVNMKDELEKIKEQINNIV